MSEYLGSQPVSGIKTGFNDAYYVDTQQRNQLVTVDQGCESLLRRFLRGRDVKRWQAVWADQWHIIIPSSQNYAWPWSNIADGLEAEIVFAQTYPSIYAHLKQHESKLKLRTDKGKFWWELRACDLYSTLEEPKLVVQAIAYHSQFALDTGSHYINDTVLFMPANLYVLGILNSRVTWWVIDRVFQHVKDGGLKVQVQTLPILPIPQCNPELRYSIEQIVSMLTDESHDRLELEFRLNELVCEAFQLTTAERQILESSLPLRDPIAVLTRCDVGQGLNPNSEATCIRELTMETEGVLS